MKREIYSMRKLSATFLEALQTGFLSGITHQVQEDTDLDLEIRDNSINIYYKGNSLLKLTEAASGRYRPSIHKKFLGPGRIGDLVDLATTESFLASIPGIKQNILQHGKSSLEIEYEQMLIRANNYEPRNNSEYFIVDRQYVTRDSFRFDLTGFYWSRIRRRKNQTVSPCLIEVKYALNSDIQNVHEQLEHYYSIIEENPATLADEIETIFRQKVDLGLYKQSAQQLEALKTLKFSRNLSDFQFLLVLLDYNPHSKLFNQEKLAGLRFANQVKIFCGGFAMWGSRLHDIQSNQARKSPDFTEQP